MPSFPSLIIGLTVAAMAVHTAVTMAPPAGLSGLRAVMDLEAGADAAPFIETSAHHMPRIVPLTTAEYRETAARSPCSTERAADHAHVFCDGAGGTDEDALESRPRGRSLLWNAHAALGEDEDEAISGG